MATVWRHNQYPFSNARFPFMHSLPEKVDCNATSSLLEVSKKILNLVFSFFFCALFLPKSCSSSAWLSRGHTSKTVKRCMTSKQLKHPQKSYCFWRGIDWTCIDQIILIQNMVPLFNEAPWNCCQSEEETRPRVCYTFIGTLTISILGTNCIWHP